MIGGKWNSGRRIKLSRQGGGGERTRVRTSMMLRGSPAEPVCQYILVGSLL